MGEKIMQVALGLLAAATLSVIIMLAQKRKNSGTWSGTVAAIERHTRREDGYDNDYVSIRYIRDDGEMRSFGCDASSYPIGFKDLEPGDRLVKPTGAGAPQRVAAAGW